MEDIRNFSIIAHIDHGKSTLADRFLGRAGMVSAREYRDQILDSMDIERERGITIKSQTVTLPHTARDGRTYRLNLIDTPGHVDFSYEVSRALASCEGALLLVDASQGVEAQTLANLYLALEHDLEVIPVINKIDLPSADVEAVLRQIEHDLGLDPALTLQVSAKEGWGLEELLEAIVERIPSPKGDRSSPLKARIFDAQYDDYRGTVIHMRVHDGLVRAGDLIKFWSNNAVYKVEEVGQFRLSRVAMPTLGAGEVGYMLAGVKTVSDVNNGDTVTLANTPCKEPLPGFREVKPVVFSSFYPVTSDEYEDLAKALEKLKLNDASLVYEKDSSQALGMGFRCGFLGLLHLDVVQERLEREFGTYMVITAPSVRYKILLKDGSVLYVDNPANYPDPARIEHSEEPYVRAAIILPETYVGAVLPLCIDRRGVQKEINYLGEKRVELVFVLPLAEVIYDFYDRLKSATRGYASFDYELIGYQQADLVKLEILVNGEPVDALSLLVHRERSVRRARQICESLQKEIPRQLFKVPIQGAIGGQIIARTTINPMRKDVTAKCYGGDISRKRKLLEKQKEGKKRMKMVGKVEIPQKAFLSVLRSSDD